MKKNTNQENTFKNKGFYIALALCLLTIGVAVFIGVSATLEDLNRQEEYFSRDTSTSQQADVNISDEDDANDIIEDVGKNESEVTIDFDISSDTSDYSSESTEDGTAQVVNPQPEVSAETPTVSEAAPVVEAPVVATTSPQVFMLPLEGDIINPFSNNEMVKSKTLNEWRTHDGVDIKSPANTPVKATSDGTIEEVVEDPMWGVCVTIAHANSYKSMYMGLKPNVPVVVGSEVKIGDVIGYVGNTAEIEIAEESHLHFAMKKDDNWIDPLSMME